MASPISYAQVVDILRVSQDRPQDRKDRFATFRRAVDDYGSNLEWPVRNSYLIAGTNGKGSVAKTLETLLSAQPHSKVGLFTSPHLMEPTERIRSRGADLSPDEMVQAYQLISATVNKFDLSHFEILTLMMIEVFFGGRLRDRVTHAVIEVGVGGRLDPTRVVPHQTAVIASLGMDHEALLGSTLELIAKEKLAIAEGAERLIYMRPDPSLRAIFEEAAQVYAPCEFREARLFPSEVRPGPKWFLKTPWGEGEMSLLGERAVQNTSLALEVLHASGERPDFSRLKDVRWPARMERMRVGDRDVYLSGDHNEQGVESLRELISHFDYDRAWLVVGVGKGKPAESMLSIYRKISRAELILTMTSFRPLSSDEFARLPVDRKIQDPLAALEFALKESSARDLVVVSGSLYLVGDLRAALLSQSERLESRKPIK